MDAEIAYEGKNKGRMEYTTVPEKWIHKGGDCCFGIAECKRMLLLIRRRLTFIISNCSMIIRKMHNDLLLHCSTTGGMQIQHLPSRLRK